VLAQVPDTPEGRKFVQDLANLIFTKFGIWVRVASSHGHLL
jgi:hypothetical protein